VERKPRNFAAAASVTHSIWISYAREKLGWKPKAAFPRFVRLMVDSDAVLVRGGCESDVSGGVKAGNKRRHRPERLHVLSCR
jgi:hypothetical protein